MTQVTVEGLPKILAKLEKLAKWNENDHNALVEINQRVGNVFAMSAKANVKDFTGDIKVYEKTGRGSGRNPGNQAGKVRMVVKKGQLRRSIGVWQPRKNDTRVLAGPMTNTMGRRKTRKNADGWFSHIVETGHFFGKQTTTSTVGAFGRSKKATEARMRNLHLRLLQNRFGKYMK
jgi:hypothetical protein